MANKKTEITTSFTADITGLKKGISEAQRQIKLANAEFKAAASGMDDWRKSSDGLQAKITQLKTVLTQQNKVLENYRKQLELVEQSGGENTKKADDLRVAIANQQAAINKTTKELNGYESELDQMRAAEDASGKSAEQLAEETKRAGDAAGMAKEGYTMLKNILANLAADAIRKAIDGLVQLGKTAIDTGKNFSSAMSEVQSISGASVEEMAMLEKTAREFGASTVFSASEAADALKYMSLAGWDAQQSAAALGGVLDLAAASGMALGSASDMVTDYLTAFGMSAKDSAYFADVLAYAQSNANTTAEQLGEAYKNSAALLHASGQDMETVTSLLAAMANQGLKGAEAGTALSAVMRDITNKMDDGKISIGDMSVAVQDSHGNFRDLTDILADVESALVGMGDAEKMTALSATFTSRSLKGVSLLLNSSTKSTAEFEKALRSASGTAKAMSDVMTDNLEGDLTKLNSHFEEMQIQLYKKVEPALREGVTALNGLIDKGAALAEKVIPKIVSGFTWLVNNINTVSSLLTGLVAGFVAMKTVPAIITAVGVACDLLTGSEYAAAAAQEFLNAVMNLNPAVLLVSAFAALTLGLTAYMANADFSTQKTIELNAQQQELVDTSKELTESIEASSAARKDEMDKMKAQKTLATRLVDELKKYTDENGNVVSGQERVKEIVGELNDIMPDLNLAYDEQAGLLSQSTAELEKNIAAMWKQAEAAAAQAQATEIMKERIDVETQMIRIEGQVAEAEATVAQAAQDRVDKMARLRQQLADGVIDQIEYDNEVKAAAIAFMDETAAAREVIDANNELEAQLGGLEEEQSALNDIVSGVSSSFTEQGQAVSDLATETGEATEEMKGRWDDLYDAVANSVGSQVKLFDEYTGQVAKSKDEIIKNMGDQVAALQDWSKNLQELSKKGISEGLLQELAKMGPDGAAYVAAFNDMTGTELQEANRLFEQAAIIPDTTAAAVKTNYEELGQYRWQSYQTGSKTAAAKIQPEMAREMEETGEMSDKGLAKGVKNNTKLVETEFSALAKSGLKSMNNTLGVMSPSKETMKSGQYVDQGLALGITNNKGLPVNAAAEMARAVIEAVKNAFSKDAFVEIGKQVGSGLIEGMNAKLADVKKTAKTLGDEAAKATKEALKVKSPSRVFKYIGEMSGEGYLDGIKETFRNSEVAHAFTSAAAEVRNGVSNLSNTIGGSAAPASNSTVTNYSFVQNNTSPKALNRLDIYRQTQNQLKLARML